jgi:hypothetical protein
MMHGQKNMKKYYTLSADCILHKSHNKQWLFPYTVLTGLRKLDRVRLLRGTTGIFK